MGVVGKKLDHLLLNSRQEYLHCGNERLSFLSFLVSIGTEHNSGVKFTCCILLRFDFLLKK